MNFLKFMLTRIVPFVVVVTLLATFGAEGYGLPLLQHLQQNSDPSEPAMLRSPFFQGILPMPVERVCFPHGVIGIVIHWDFSILQPELNLITEVMGDLERYGTLDTDSINQTHQQTLQSLDRANDRYRLFLRGVNARFNQNETGGVQSGIVSGISLGSLLQGILKRSGKISRTTS